MCTSTCLLPRLILEGGLRRASAVPIIGEMIFGRWASLPPSRGVNVPLRSSSFGGQVGQRVARPALRFDLIQMRRPPAYFAPLGRGSSAGPCLNFTCLAATHREGKRSSWRCEESHTPSELAGARHSIGSGVGCHEPEHPHRRLQLNCVQYDPMRRRTKPLPVISATWLMRAFDILFG
jgi:hypothetical protein